MEKVPQNGRPPQPVSAYDWASDSFSYDVSQMNAAQIWRTAVAMSATTARQALPQSHSRIEAATQLVLAGHVEINLDRTAAVRSASQPDVTYTVDGSCPCQDFPCAPERTCKHTMARGMVLRAMQLAKELGSSTGLVTIAPERVQAPQEPAQAIPPVIPPPSTGDGTTIAPAPDEPAIPAQFVVALHGKRFVLYAGLLTMSHQSGLVSLTEEFTHVTADYVIAKAVATFADGRTFTGAADASPKNVNAQVAKHLARCALTRAKARALRDALDIGMTAFEELD